MKDIKLCGLGNGLLDLQYEVDDEHLVKFGLNKGEMRLVSAESQAEMISSVGNLKFNKSSGGSAANTIIAFAQFGGKSAYQTTLGNDDFGKHYADEFKELGIELSTEFLTEEPTGTCLVLITPDSERTMNTHLGASALFIREHINEDLIKRSEWIYLEGYKLTAESSADAVFKAIEIAKINNTKISFTFSDVFVVEFFREEVEKVVANSDLIFCNENEAKAFTKCENLEDAFTKLAEACPNVVMTLGANGSMIRFEGKTYKIPAYPAKPIDSTGAGDIFAGGFLYGLLYEGSAEKAGHIASYSAARVVSQMGARLKENHKELINKVLVKFS